MKNKFFFLIIFLIISSCAPTRNLVYFNDLNSAGEYTEEIKNKIDPVIQPDDLLSITVSSLNPESNMLFNSGVMQPIGSTSSAIATNKTNDGYLVDKSGDINFPVLGSVKLAGLTKAQATDKMTAQIRNSVKNPIVNIRFLNFKITVIGEVNRPSTFTVLTEKISLLEALSLAGDLTSYGKRENILLIREKNGIRSTVRIDLASKTILNSPYYYLQQNDVIYVQPVKIKALQGSQSTFYIPLVTVLISIISLIVVFRK
jgi:polysaccharide export outer membrane protein